MFEKKEAFMDNPYRIYELSSLQRGEVVKLVNTRDDEAIFSTFFVVLKGCRLARAKFDFVFYITAEAVIFEDDTLCVDEGLLANEIAISLNDYCVVHPSPQDIVRLNRLFVGNSYPFTLEYTFV